MNILKNKYFILGNILLLLAVIPLTLFVVKRQTNLKSKATPSTTLSFTPTTASVATGKTTSFDIMVNPGQNVVSIIEIIIQVDPDKLEIASLTNNDSAFPVKLRGPTINADGTANLSVSTSNDVQKAIQAPTKVATLVLKGKAPTNGAASVVKLDKSKSQVFSLATSDGATENVLSDTGTTSVTITGSAVSSGQKPTCSALNTDRSVNGTVPYAITFTGIGTVATGTISKASFNFGDGTSQDVTSAGGLGTNSVNVSISHSYTIPGTYNATVILTDSNGNASDVGVCTKSITVNVAGGGDSGIASPSATITPTTTVIIPTTTPTVIPVVQNPAPTLPVTGTLETTLAVMGGIGVALVIGIFLFVL